MDARFAHARLATVGGTILIAIAVWRAVLSYWWLLLPAVVFVWLIQRHDRVLRSRADAIRGIRFFERGLARIEDRWRGGGEPGERFRDDRHVYANDLDLFGTGSLFELLSLARTYAGEETLARWLLNPAEAVEVRERQEAVRELGPLLDLREQLAVAGTEIRESVRTGRLLEWAESPLPPSRSLSAFTAFFGAAFVAAVAYMAITSAWWPLGLLVLLQGLVFRRLRDQINRIVSGKDPETAADFVADALVHRTLDLDVLTGLLTTLEVRQFQGARLRQLQARLNADGQPASRIIRRLHRYSEIHAGDKNAAVVPLVFFMFGQIEIALALGAMLQLLRPVISVAVARWRSRYGGQVRAWLDTIAEFEALTSLSAYRYEHPDDPFPEIVAPDDSSGSRALFDGGQLGHPLLPADRMVPNDVHLGTGTQLLVVSGSNMSGKSTLLRTVGINAVLALAGAPVRATSLRLSPLAVGATLRIQDSLLEGRSRFYAEITRIRELADIAAGPVPALFLLDELFHGTNSHDRLAGAEGVLRSLLDRGAIGLITTHDLAVTAVADALAPRAANVHFQDWFDGTEMRFDYLMKTGPVTHSNALALMRAVGLEVPAVMQGSGGFEDPPLP
jgi:MutS domain V